MSQEKEKDTEIKQPEIKESTEPAVSEKDWNKEVADLQEKVKAAEDKYLRLFAEFDNFRKRSENEKTEFSKYATVKLLKDLLPIMDSFEQSKKSFEKHTNEVEDLKKGLYLIHKLFEDTLIRFGVKAIEAKGKKFDPQYHEAMMLQDSKEESQTVLEVVQPGFMIHDRVLRPAMVIVAK